MSGNKIYPTDIRVKYILQILHQVLVVLLKFLVKKHPHCSDKNDLEKSLSEVLGKNFKDFKGSKLFTDLNYRRHFCFVDLNNTKKLTNQLKATIDIESLDIAVLTLLVTKKFIFEKSNLTKCCSNCKHNKCSCGLDPKDCPNKANCGLINCPACKKSSCGVVTILKFCNVARSLRNCFAHAADDVYQKLEKNNGGLEEFPRTKTWRKLWSLVQFSTCCCLKIILKNDPKLLSMEMYEDFNMELRIALKKDIHFLIPSVESNVGHYYEKILAIENSQEQISKLHMDICKLKKDGVLWKAKWLNFGDEALKESFTDINHVDEGCILQYNSKYEKILIQYRQIHGEWNPLSETSTKTTTVGDSNEVEVNHLNIGCSYEFRGLFENNKGEIILLTSKESIKIKKVKAKDVVIVDGKRLCIEDVQISRLDIKSVCLNHIEIIYDNNFIQAVKNIEVWDCNQSEEWENGDWEQTEIEHDNILQGLNVVLLKSLEKSHTYDIRLIGLGNDGEIKILTRHKVKIIDATHKVFFHNNLLVSHPFGLQTDASQHLEGLRKEDCPEHSTFTFSYKSGGGLEESHITDNECIRYVEENFWLGESGKKNIVVPDLEQLDQKSLNFQISMKLKNLLSNQNNFLLTSVNFYNYLANIGYSKKELEDRFECHLKDLPNVLILYPAEYPAVILITLPESEKDTIHNLWLKADANLKAYLTLHRHRLIGKEGFMIINAIGAVFYEESKLPLQSYCCLCIPDLFIFAKDFENDLQQWWRRLKRMMARLSNEYRIKNDSIFSPETASLLVLFAALTDDRFPTLFAGDDERITKMVLNQIQRNILLNPSPRKIIIGGYGCGKSIIVHQQIQRYQEKDNSILCYLGMDEYSLHQVLVDEHCAKISERLKQKIVSKSVVDISLDARSLSRLLSFTECLAEIQKSYPGKQIDIVVDELDCEDFNEQEVVKLKNILELPAFKSSMFYLALQSCQKKRQMEHNGKVQKETNTCYKDLGIEIFELQKTMRFTSNIGSAVTNSQEKVEKKPNFYPCNIPKQTNIREGNQDRVVSAPPPHQVEDEDVNAVNQTYFEHIVDAADENQTRPKASSMKVPTMKMDSSFRYSEVEESSTKVISYFEYIKSNGSGVNIQGDKPRLLRLNNNKSAQRLAYFLEEHCQRQKKMMLICNTEDLINLAKAALQTVKLTYVEYTDSIRGKPAKATSSKKAILDNWRKDKQVLLVDCRGCRGMECQEVVVLWDEADYHSKHMFGESIARARSLLQIVTVKSGNNSNKSDMNEVIDTLIKESHVEDVTEDCYAHAHIILNIVPVCQSRDPKAENLTIIKELNNLQIQPLLSTIKSNFLKWDGKKYHEVNVNGNTLRFDDVWKMLKDKKFDDVSRIINKQPNLINAMRDEWGLTFLMYAARIKRKAIVGYISNQPHDLSVVNDIGSNVLHWIVWCNYDDDVTFEMLNSLEISQLNDDVINKQDNNKHTPLHFAAMKNNHKSIVWLMDQGADPSLKDYCGQRPGELRWCSDETKNIIRNFKKW